MITNTCATCKRKFPAKRGNILIFASKSDIFQQINPQITVLSGSRVACFMSSSPELQENPPHNPNSPSSVHRLPSAFCRVRTLTLRYAVERPDKPIADHMTRKGANARLASIVGVFGPLVRVDAQSAFRGPTSVLIQVAQYLSPFVFHYQLKGKTHGNDAVQERYSRDCA